MRLYTRSAIRLLKKNFEEFARKQISGFAFLYHISFVLIQPYVKDKREYLMHSDYHCGALSYLETGR